MARAMNLTNEEKRLFGQLFKQCDPETLGIVTGEVARTIFERSGLPPRVLGEIWQLADTDNNGFLDQVGFSLALRLIGYAQDGTSPSLDLAANAGPLPVFDNKPRPDPYGGTGGNGSGENLPSPPPLGQQPQLLPQLSGIRVPSLSPADRNRFISLFQKSAPSGFLEGDQARTIFLKARLSNEILGQIWALADTRNRGQLDQTEFVVAMHFIQCILNGTLTQLPRQLPPGLYEAAAGARPSSAQPVMSPNMMAGRRNMSASPGQQQPWVITPHDKLRFDQMFDTLDKHRKGVIGAQEAVPFMTRSKLPEDTLAQIWDLADMHNTGEFTKVEFAIAMYLVQQKLNGKELPATLPASVISSVKAASNAPGRTMSPSQGPSQTKEAQTSPPPPQRAMSGSLNDLVSLNDVFSTPSPTPKAPAQQQQGPGGIKRQTTGDFHTFVPTSSFGQSLVKPPGQAGASAPTSPPATAVPVAAAPASATVSAATQASKSPEQDFMTDAAAAPKDVSAASVELANLSNQVSSLTGQTVALSEKRKKTESDLSQIQNAKAEIVQKLTLLRASYDSEVKRVQETTSKLDECKKEYEQASKDYSVVEASLAALRTQYESVSGQLANSQTQHQAIKDQIRAANDEIASLKTAVEAAEREAKQHASVLAVSQSQLEVSQAERARLEGEIANARSRNEETARKIGEINEEARVINENNQTLMAQAEAESRSMSAAPENMGMMSRESVTSPSGHHGSAANSFIGRTTSPGNPFAYATRDNSSFEQAFQDMSMGDNANPSESAAHGESNFGAPVRSTTEDMSQTQSHITETTLSSSPPTSEFPTSYNNIDNQIPAFTLPIARPGSATSSVQNNPPQSVRGDIPSHPDSPADVTGEQVSGIVPPESLDLNNSEDRGSDDERVMDTLTGADRSLAAGAMGGSAATLSANSKELRESDGSYEFVDEHDGEANTIRPNNDFATSSAGPSGTEPESATAAAETTSAHGDSTEAIPGAFPQKKEEFPPIRELDQNDSSSDEEGPESVEKPHSSGHQSDSRKNSEVEKFLTPESTGVAGGSGSAGATSKPALPETDETEFSFGVHSPAKEDKEGHNVDDMFDDAFADLSEAQDEKFDIEQEDLNEFESAFKAMGTRQGPASEQQPAEAVSSPTSPGATGDGAQPSNDEWEQLFAGFSGGPAGQQEINDAFQPRAPVTPRTEAIQELCGMGFSEKDAKDALEHTKYNLSEASNYLLDRKS